MWHYLRSCLLLLLLLLTGVLYLLYTVLNLWYQRRRYSDIPSPPRDDFWNGHMITMKSAKKNNTFLDVFTKWTKTYGKSLAVFVRFRAIIFTVDPAILKVVFQDLHQFSKANDLPNRSLFGQRIAGWDSVLTGGGTNWAIKRKIMSKFFAKSNMEQLFNLCKPLVDTYMRTVLRPKVGSGTILELHEELSTLFSAIPAAVGVLGFYEPAVIGRNITQILEMIPKQIGDKFSFSKLRFQASKEKLDTIDMVIEMRSRLKKMIVEKRAEMSGQDEDTMTTDMLGLLILANDTCDFVPTLVDEYVVDDMMTVYLVMDNMVKQIASTFIFLKDYPEIYTKLAAELRATDVSRYRGLAELRYTEKVMLESMRLAPALLRGTRVFTSTNGQRKLLGHLEVPSGTQIHFSQYMIHRDGALWAEPDKMIPERWRDDFNPEPFTYLPFLMGPRGCLGKHVAMLTMKLILSGILNNFELKPRFDPKNLPVFDQGMAVMRIRNGVDYEFIPRN